MTAIYVLHSDIHASTWTILVADVIYNKAIFNGVITLIQSPGCNGPSPGEALSENDFDSPPVLLFSLMDTQWITSV